MYVLFDIDATLISTGGVGMEALTRAGRDLHGPAFSRDGVDYAGRLDPLIFADLLRANRLEPTPDRLASLRAGYAHHLAQMLSEDPALGRPLPGVEALLDALRALPGVGLGLLTGNFPETGRLKLRACGIDDAQFHVSVWGDESPHLPPAREHLAPIGVQRFARWAGAEIEPTRVTIVGDTPHDIRCAHAGGCRSLGVATGLYSVEDLHAAGAHRVVPDLSATDELVAWLLGQGASETRGSGSPARTDTPASHHAPRA